jgi:hypothetical protein
MKAIQFSQKPNAMLGVVKHELEQRGFRVAHQHQQYSSLSAAGYDILRISHRQQVAKLLGSIRPKRLLPMFEPEQLGGMDTEKIDLVRKEDVGLQPVIAVQTSTRTFIAEGFASHNCTVAAAGHMIQSWSTYAGTGMKTIPDDQILSAYNTLSPNDQGCFMLDVLNYWRKPGIGGDMIEAFVETGPADITQAMLAIEYFGSCYIGMSLPDTNTFGPWDVADPQWKPNPYNGHAVCLIGYDNAIDMFKVATWGEVWNMSFNWFRKYCDESYAVLNDIELNATGVSPEGFDFPTLQQDLKHIGDPIVDPVTPPTPPTPEPTPTPTPNPEQVGPLEITGVGGAYWIVCMDDLAQSPQHSQQFEAVEHADKLRYANPGATIEIRHSAVYRVV